MLSKLGICSRSEAERWVIAGRVSVDGTTVRDPHMLVTQERSCLAVDGIRVAAVAPVYIMLNKPRGLVVSAADERGRSTVYAPLAAAGLPWLGPVGRLDKASEGLLLLSNDTVWAAGITEPTTHVEKTYHVQIDRLPDDPLVAAISAGVEDCGELLRTSRISVVRQGSRHAWLEIVLVEGRNRHIRRLLAAHAVGVLRLVRVAIGSLQLGALEKGAWRHLSVAEVASLKRAQGGMCAPATRLPVKPF